MNSTREIRLRFLTALLRGVMVEEISFMQVHLSDPYAAQQNPAAQSVLLSPSNEGAGRAGRQMALTTEQTRHQFAMEPLGNPGSSGAQPYLYTCVHCRWIFRVDGSRGSIIALDEWGRHLPERESSLRIMTFPGGQCPAFEVLEYPASELQLTTRLAGYLSRFVEGLRSLSDGRLRTRTH
jgi:hypothetical protein